VRALVLCALATACSGDKPAPAPAAARPTLEECHTATSKVLLIGVAALEPGMRDFMKEELERRGPDALDERCAAGATPAQVACLGAAADYRAVMRCAEPLRNCLGEQRDQKVCDAAMQDWGWAADFLLPIFRGEQPTY
jgi:hypothetical protein